MSTATPPTADLYLVVGYDGSQPASRALDAAISLLHGRAGHIEVIYVAHIPAVDTLSADAMAEMKVSFDELARDLRAQASDQVGEREERWAFQWRDGIVADELIAAAVQGRDARPGDYVAIVVGSSTHAMHRMIGSAAVSLARRSPVALVIVP